MGIKGLINFVQKASLASSIKDFEGCTMAVDAYNFLYKGAIQANGNER